MLFCFDVDGTLLTDEMENEGQYVKGTIPTKTLSLLELAGHKVVIVSPSPFRPDGFKVFARNESNDYRWENIQDAMDYYGITDKSDVIYVDDLQLNRIMIIQWGVDSYSPNGFLMFIEMKRYI